MDDRVKIMNGNEQGYTAKEAMQHVVAIMKKQEAHAIEILTVDDSIDAGNESILFVKMVMRFLHKNSRKVFLLAQNGEALHRLADYMEEKYSKIQVVEMVSWEEQVVSYDTILNRINGAEAECVIAAISVTEQDAFMEQYRTALDAKIWLGIGTNLQKKKGKFSSTKFGKFILGILTKTEKE